MKKEMRNSGINIIGSVPWGTHLCQFYQTREDLLDILVPYFKAGLENNEFCIWVTSESLKVEDVRTALEREVKDLQGYFERSQLEILDYRDWYTRSGKFDATKVLQGWVEKEKQAIERGFEGLRLTGNTFWLEKNDWKDFSNYEVVVDNVIGKYNMLAICTYCLDKCRASEILEVVKNHQFALIRQEGKWEVIEISERGQVDLLQKAYDELEIRIGERTAELVRANTDLREEIVERKQAEKTLRKSEEKFRSIFEHAKEGIIYLDILGRIVDVNPEAIQIFGGSKEELVGKHFTRVGVFSLKDIPKLLSKFTNTLAGKEATISIWIKNRKDQRIALECSASLIKAGEEATAVMVITRDVTERKWAEEALKESEDRFRTLAESAQCGISILQREKSIYNNPAVLSFTGYTKQELEHMSFWDIVRSDFKELVKQRGLGRQEGKPALARYEIPIITKSGEERWVDISAGICELKGKPAVISTALDITERKKAEKVLRASEQRYRLLFEQNLAAVYRTTLDGTVLDCNEAFARLLGYASPQEVMKHNASEFYFDDKERQEFLRLLHKKGYLSNFEISLRRKDGTPIWILENISLIKEEENSSPVVQGTSIDITERKRTENELRKFNTISDKAGHGVAIVDLKGNISYVNTSFARMHGYTPDELIGKHLSIFHTEKQMANVNRLIEQLNREGSYVGEEVWHKRNDSTEFPTLMNGTLVKDENGTPLFMAATAIDITQRKKAEETLKESEEKLKKQAKRLAAINAIGSTVSRSLELDEVLPVALEKTIETLELAAGAIYLLDENTDELVMRTHKNLPQQFVKKVARVKLRNAEFFDSPLRTGKVLTVNDLSQHPEIAKITDEKWHNSVAVVPLKAKNRVLGNINLLGPPGKPFTSDDIVILTAIGHQIGVAIDNAILYEQAQREITERKKAEEKFRTIFESVPISMIVIDKDGIMVEVSPYQVYQTAKGLTPREGYIGKSLITHPTIVNAGLSDTYRGLLKGEPFDLKDYYFPSIQRGTEGYYFNIKGVPLFKEGEVIGALTVHEDITERKKAEEALRESEKKYRDLFENAREAIVTVDLDGRITNANKLVEEYGFKREELFGKMLFDFIPEYDKARSVSDFNILIGGKPVKGEMDVITPKGIFTVEYRDNPIVRAGKVIGVQIILTDITERKQAEEALRESERKYRNLVEDSLDGICIVQGLEIKFVNQSMLKMFGCQSENEMVDHEFTQFVLPEYRKIMKEMGFARERGENIPQRYEFKGLRKDGTEFNAELSVSRIPYQGNVARQGIIRDITERKKTEEKLKEANTIINRSPAVAFTWKNQEGWPVEFVSENVEKLFGYTAKDFTSRKISYADCVHPDDLERVAGEVAAFSSEEGRKEFVHQPYRIKTKDGLEKIINDWTFIVRDEKGKITHYKGIVEDITERRKAEEALKESEERYRNLFENAPIGIYRTTPDGRILIANPAIIRMLGYSSFEELASRNLEKEGYKTSYPRKQFKQLIESQDEVNGFEATWIKSDKSEIFVRENAKVFRDDKGAVLYYEGTAEDITERKWMEEKYQAIVKTAPDSFGLHDLEGRFLEVNDSCCKMFGYTREELLTMSMPDIETVENPEMIAQHIKKVMTQGYDRFETRHKRKDGKIIDVEVSANYLDVEEGRLVVFVRDITERKKAEEEIRKLSQYLESVIDNANVWLDVLDEKANVVIWNKAAEQISGYSREEVIGHGRIWEWLYPDENYRNEIVTKAAAIIEKGEVVEDLETIIQCKNGEIKTISWHSRNLIGVDGKPIGSIALGRDVTERKKLMQQLIQSEKLAAVGTLAYGIAHEFNNILAGVMSSAEFGSTTSDPESIKESFNLITENTKRASSITSDLLSFAREKEGKKESTDLTQHLKSVLAITRRELEKTNIKIVEEFKPIPDIYCDPGQFSEVFLNLITNARDAMLPEGGTLTIKIDSQKDDIRIIFKDTGCGIPNEIKGRIFDPFVTTKGALGKSEIPGTGLGLFLTYGIIDSYQGKIEVESKVGKGAQFTILIPISENLAPKSFLEKKNELPEETQKKLNILLVDDEMAICKTLGKFLKSKGHQVTFSVKAKEGLDSFKKKKFDVVLSDITMPDMDGIELVKRIREKDKKTKIIIMTGHILRRKEDEAKGAGADEVLIKPFENKLLYQTISRLVSE